MHQMSRDISRVFNSKKKQLRNTEAVHKKYMV